jgi:nitroreductase
MDVYRAIVTKRDTRAYQQRPVPNEAIMRILNAGRMAGSSKNGQPVRFLVMRERDNLHRLAACGQFTTPMLNAPLAIAVLLRQDGRPFDAGRAAQSMMLAAWEQGITSCPVAIQNEECGRAVVGAPAEYHIAMVITMGYPEPSQPLSRGQPRLPLDELVHWERWSE